MPLALRILSSKVSGGGLGLRLLLRISICCCLRYANKANFLDKIGNYKLAIIYYDKALAIDPKNIDAIKGKQQTLATLNQTASVGS